MNNKSWAITFSVLYVLSIIGGLSSAMADEINLALLFAISVVVNFIAMLVAIHLATRAEEER